MSFADVLSLGNWETMVRLSKRVLTTMLESVNIVIGARRGIVPWQAA